MRLDGAEFRKVEDDEPYEATMKYGPGIQGGFLSFDHVQEHTAKGIQSAPKFALALQCADRLLGTAFGKWEAARNVRS